MTQPDEAVRIAMVRRSLAGRQSQRAMQEMLTGLGKFRDNEAFLASIPLPR